jgi:hypothetical protein
MTRSFLPGEGPSLARISARSAAFRVFVSAQARRAVNVAACRKFLAVSSDEIKVGTDETWGLLTWGLLISPGSALPSIEGAAARATAS